MGERDTAIRFIAGHLCRPIQKRNVEQTVNDQAVVVACSLFPPRLKELSLFLKPRNQIVCCEQRRLLGGLASPSIDIRIATQDGV